MRQTTTTTTTICFSDFIGVVVAAVVVVVVVVVAVVDVVVVARLFVFMKGRSELKANPLGHRQVILSTRSPSLRPRIPIFGSDIKRIF